MATTDELANVLKTVGERMLADAKHPAPAVSGFACRVVTVDKAQFLVAVARIDGEGSEPKDSGNKTYCSLGARAIALPGTARMGRSDLVLQAAIYDRPARSATVGGGSDWIG